MQAARREVGKRLVGLAPHIIDRRLFDKSGLLQRVLITRPEPGATQTASRLVALGFDPVLAPVMAIVAGQVSPPAHVVATLLTSRNAVAACPSALYNRPVFAVGAATATCAAASGFTRVISANGDASDLAALVADMLHPTQGSLFLPTAQGQGAELANSLRRQGFRVVRRVAYKALGVQLLPEAAATHLSQGDLAFAMFFSGETSRCFERLIRAANLVEALRAVEAVSISERAAAALKSLPWRRISVAAKPNQDAMLALLK